MNIEKRVSLTYVPSEPSSSTFKKLTLPVIYTRGKNPKPVVDLRNGTLWDADGVVYHGELIFSRKLGVLPKDVVSLEDEYDPWEEKTQEEIVESSTWDSLVERMNALRRDV